MTEEWKPVIGFEGYYEVSNFGQIRTVARTFYHGRKIEQHIRRTKKNNRDYIMIALRKDGKEFTKLVHRLVAEAFIPNPENLPQVNHKDEDKNNNHADNLEWCTNLYNRHYGTGYQRSVQGHDYMKQNSHFRKPVIQKDFDGNVVGVWEYAPAAARHYNTSPEAIRKCCAGYRDSAIGYKWEYV